MTELADLVKGAQQEGLLAQPHLARPVTAQATVAPSKTIRIVHASGEVFDNQDQAKHDVRHLDDLNAVILCGTESGTRERQRMLAWELGQMGYHAFVPGGTDGWVAIHKNFVGNSTVEARYDKVRNSGAENDDPHPYAAAGVISMAFEHLLLGRITVVGGGHYLTKGRFPGQEKLENPGDPVDHRAENRDLAHAMSEACIEASRGNGISFFTADTNMVDRDDDVFFGKPLTTCWDEIGKHPDTGHGNIDVIGSVNLDSRVECKDAWVLNDSQFFQHSDHFPVVAEYTIRKLNQESQ